MPRDLATGAVFRPAELNWRVGAPRPRLGDEILLLSLLVGVALLSVVLSPHSDGISLFDHKMPPMCIFHMVTGHRCPGCGLTRSFTFMGHGEIVQAFRMHVLGPFLYLWMLQQIGAKTLAIVRHLRDRRATGDAPGSTPPVPCE